MKAEINNTTLHYLLDGPPDGEAVMLSNSLGADAGMWKYQVPELVKAGYRVVRYDNRGHGMSPATPPPYSLEILTGDALGLMDHLGLEKVHFCGLSLGGMVGQMLGAHHPERLVSLTLCATASFMTLTDAEWEERTEVARRHGVSALADATLERWFTSAGRTRLLEDVEETKKSILGTSFEGYAGCIAALRAMDLREAIGRISTPTLIIVGDQDEATPVDASEFIHSRIASSSLVVIPEAAHLVNIERREIFNEHLLAFLAKNTVPSP